MRLILQRVSQASVAVDGAVVGEIAKGWLALVGIGNQDSSKDAAYLADKTLGLRAFPDQNGKMNLSLAEADGAVLAVSQFTLYADCRKGRRPGFSDAAAPEIANELYERYVQLLRDAGAQVATGKFQAHMQVSLVNDGPVTFLLDSKQ